MEKFYFELLDCSIYCLERDFLQLIIVGRTQPLTYLSFIAFNKVPFVTKMH